MIQKRGGRYRVVVVLIRSANIYHLSLGVRSRVVRSSCTRRRVVEQPAIKIGNRIGPQERRVDPDWAMAYALATNDPNPAYVDGGVVPPVFTVSMILPIFLEAYVDTNTPGAVTGATGGAHGLHDLYLHKPVKPGETLHFFADGYSATNTPAGALVTVRVQLYDESDDLCVEHFWSSI